MQDQKIMGGAGKRDCAIAKLFGSSATGTYRPSRFADTTWPLAPDSSCLQGPQGPCLVKDADVVRTPRTGSAAGVRCLASKESLVPKEGTVRRSFTF